MTHSSARSTAEFVLFNLLALTFSLGPLAAMIWAVR